MTGHILAGFGFGPIQAGLFFKEAMESGNFSRLIAGEIDGEIVRALRKNGGTYHLNIAAHGTVERIRIGTVEVFDLTDRGDRCEFVKSLGEATEIVTALPSVALYEKGDPAPAEMIAEALSVSRTEEKIIYTAENNNRAAELLEEAVFSHGKSGSAQFLNTVIGKMSRVVSEPDEIRGLGLAPVVPGFNRALLVEEFNRILVSRTTLPGLLPGIGVFIEKEDLLPFEEAKLYGHNAIHALLGFLGALKGCKRMAELKEGRKVFSTARRAFLDESGAALISKYGHIGEELFTEAGYRDYAEDLLQRITDPCLGDTVKRACRDPVRKLGYNDRLFGTMRLALEQGIEPENTALGALAGIACMAYGRDSDLPDRVRVQDWRELTNAQIEEILKSVWAGDTGEQAEVLISLVQNAQPRFLKLLSA